MSKILKTLPRFFALLITIKGGSRRAEKSRKVLTADDDEGCQTRVGRPGAGQEQAGRRLGVGQEQCQSREEARVEMEH